jgi:transcriptional regulator with XRE-family HTH domain
MSGEVGERLRSYRLDAGLQMEDLAARTRISVRHIRALEEGRFDLLPGEAFIRGFIRSLCGELGRDPEPLLQIMTRLQEEAAEEEGNNGTADAKKPFPLFLTAGILLFLVIGGVLIHGGKKKAPDTIPAAVPPEEVLSPPEEKTLASALEEERKEELDLVIRAVEKTWLRVRVDSSEAWDTTMKTGDEIRLRGMERISLFIGNAGGVLFELNGKRFGPPGSAGQVISNYVITRDNL